MIFKPLGFLTLILFFAPLQADADDAHIVSAGLGDPVLPMIANFAFCRGSAISEGFGGIPVVLSKAVDTGGGFQGDPNAVDPSLFRVAVGKQRRIVQPICATVAPAVDAGERHTVLLIGDFGTGADNGPVALRIVGELMATDGMSMRGVHTKSVGEVNNGPSMVLAEVFSSSQVATSDDSDGNDGRFCPSGETARVVKLTFSGGVTGPNGAPLVDDNTAMLAIEIVGIAADGRRVVIHPFALRDDDNDNHLDACLGADTDGLELVLAQVNSHTFYAPQNVPGRAITVPIRQFQ